MMMTTTIKCFTFVLINLLNQTWKQVTILKTFMLRINAWLLSYMYFIVCNQYSEYKFWGLQIRYMLFFLVEERRNCETQKNLAHLSPQVTPNFPTTNQLQLYIIVIKLYMYTRYWQEIIRSVLIVWNLVAVGVRLQI